MRGRAGPVDLHEVGMRGEVCATSRVFRDPDRSIAEGLGFGETAGENVARPAECEAGGRWIIAFWSRTAESPTSFCRFAP